MQDLELAFPTGPPSLLPARRLRVRGDVRFSRRVVVEGNVSVVHAGPEPLVIADGTRLAR